MPVPDEALAGAPRTPAAAVPGRAGRRSRPARWPPRWAVCDEVGPDGRIVAHARWSAGRPPVTPMPPGDGVLLADQDGASWLVSAGRRHRIDLADGRLMAAYGLDRAVPRAVSGALLAVLPEGPALRTPTVPGRGDPAPRGLPGRVGDVLVARPVGAAPRYFVVLSGGVQQVPELVAELLRVASVTRRDPAGPAGVVATATARRRAAGRRLAGPSRRGCWTRRAGPAALLELGGRRAARAGCGWAAALPVPAGTVPVALTRADGAGPLLDAVAVGAGGAVRAVGPEAGPGRGRCG